uniref:SCAN box domain-containing protein n=1 Tax=Crocodylus porosus TaxID=8502 RepID=A0A7M4F098_CROPO
MGCAQHRSQPAAPAFCDPEGRSGPPIPHTQLQEDWLKGEILRRLDITPERQRQAFRAKKPAEVRTPHILWQTLADLLGKWLRPESTSKEQIFDLVLMEQFINDLEEETQKWVRDPLPYDPGPRLARDP